MAAWQAEELREPEVEIGEARALDATDLRQVARTAEGVDGGQIQIPAAAVRLDAGRQIAGDPSPSGSSGELGPKGRLERKSPIADTCISKGSCTIPLTTSR